MARQRREVRRTANSGSVFYEKGRRRWVGRVVQADGSRRAITGPTKGAVIEKLKRLQGLGALGATEDTSITVEAWLRHWIDDVAPARCRSPQTLANHKWAVERHLIPAIGRRKLVALSTEDVEVMLKKRAADGLSRNTLMRLRAVLAKALDEAISRNRLNRNNVVRYAVLPPEAPLPKARRSMTVEQARKVLDEAARHDNGAMVHVGLMLGLRPGELTGLVWDDVDFTARTLRIDKALVRGPRSQLNRAEPKTAKSRRVVSMPEPVVRALRQHRDRQKVRRISGTDFVFATASGTPIDPSNARRSFAKMTEAAGIGRWTPVELRHSAASLLSAASVPVDQVTDLLGHVDGRMLDRHYRHATTKSYAAAVVPMETLFAASAGSRSGSRKKRK